MAKDEIDDEHDLRTREKFERRMKYENKQTTCPCADCPSGNDCQMHGRCDEYRAWNKRYIRNRMH